MKNKQTEINKNISIIKWGGDTNAKSIFKCNACGHEWTTSFKNIKNGSGCPVCSSKHKANKPSIKIEEAETTLKDNNSNISIVEWGGDSTTKSIFKCNACGHEWTTSFSNVKRSHGCPCCTIKR